jgi:uncharacterized repeat protein (TIGR03803 family)
MKIRIFGWLVIAAFAAMSGHSRAADLTTLVSFCAQIGCADGAEPQAGLLVDANGNLFGTTSGGGSTAPICPDGCGTAFEIAKTAGGYASTPITLVSFAGTYGLSNPSRLIADANGNLLGTATAIDFQSPLFDIVFEIAKTAGGYASTPITLLTLCGQANCVSGVSSDGVIADANGNVFGTTRFNGFFLAGRVFEIPATPGGYGAPAILINFNGADGYAPIGGLIVDADGNLFGTTAGGGPSEDGTVFEIVNNGTSTAPSYASTPITLASMPASGLMVDADGNLFGTTEAGGAYGYGTVFEIAKTAGGYASTPTTLASFNGANGSIPAGDLIADANGNLFGTTSEGGAYNDGTVFEIVKTSSGYASTPTTLVSFNGFNGSAGVIGNTFRPSTGVIADANGNLFGTTAGGGAYGYGTVFEITGSGFIPPGVLAGTPGQANCIGKSDLALAQKYRGLLNAAITLGYSSQGLQNEVMMYCGG